ncbi:MAG: hypothetical protein PHC51_02245 [bacterium]|nr:hypothetical protein [bacterium]
MNSSLCSKIKTEGGLMEELIKALNKAEPLVRQDFGTSNYLYKVFLQIHREFDSFCDELEIPPHERGSFREQIRKIVKGNRQFNYLNVQKFLDSTPQEFIVRGEWTSERCSVIIT